MTDLMTPTELLELLKERRFIDIELMDIDEDDKNLYVWCHSEFDFNKKVKISGHKGYLIIFMVNKGGFRVTGRGYPHEDIYRKNITFDQLIIQLDESELYKSPLIKRAFNYTLYTS